MMISIGMAGGEEERGRRNRGKRREGRGKKLGKRELGLEHGVVRNREWRIWKGEWLTGESGMDNREWGILQGGEWGIGNQSMGNKE